MSATVGDDRLTVFDSSEEETSLQLLHTAIEQSKSALIITTAEIDPPGPKIVYVNPKMEAMTGYTRDELIGETPRILQGPETDRAMLDRLRRSLAEGGGFEGQSVNYRKDGSTYHVAWNIAPVRDKSGTLRYFISSQRDITTEVESRRTQELLSDALEQSADIIFVTDPDGHIVYVNQAFECQTGYTRREVCGLTPRVLRSDAHDTAFYQHIWDRLGCGEVVREVFTNRNKQGHNFQLELTITPVRDAFGSIHRYVASGKDVTERMRMESELKRLATTDELTGLINRVQFEAVLEREMARAQRYNHALGLIMMDLDQFKSINDTLGHDAGDGVLTAFAALLRENIRSSDQAGRWGGEEFMLLVPEGGSDATHALAEKLRCLVAEKNFPKAGHVTVSCGMTVLRPNDTIKQLIKRADNNLYKAKTRNRNCVVVD